MRVLVIGGSGVVGQAVTKHLVGTQVMGTYHSNQSQGGLYADIEKTDLGLDYRALKNITHIIYAAGSTRFDMDYSDANKINVQPIKQLFEIAKKLPNLKKVIYVSTLYSSGLTPGIIAEKEHPVIRSFANTYERSKYEAEKLFLGVDQPYEKVVARISTIIADSKGRVAKYDSIHRSLQYLYLGLVGVLPGDPNNNVDMISSDYAGKMIVKLLEPKLSGVYHIASGNRSMSLADVINVAREIFSETDPGWNNCGYPEPTYTDLKTFDLMGKTLLDAGNIIVGGAYRSIATFAPQLTIRRTFSTRRSSRLRITPDPSLELYRSMVNYCIRSKWS